MAVEITLVQLREPPISRLSAEQYRTLDTKLVFMQTRPGLLATSILHRSQTIVSGLLNTLKQLLTMAPDMICGSILPREELQVFQETLI